MQNNFYDHFVFRKRKSYAMDEFATSNQLTLYYVTLFFELFGIPPASEDKISVNIFYKM